LKNDASIYFGDVVHVRSRPRRHRLRYGVFSLLIDLDQLAGFAERNRFFSRNRFNLYSFYDCDHGDGEMPLRSWVIAQLHSAGINLSGGTVRLLCYPRVLGYVFNPISIFYCYFADGTIAALLYEVHNTFGERHVYLIPVDKPDADCITHVCEKRLHVSPFIGMDARYHFRISQPGERLVVTINEVDAEGTFLQASFVGHRAPASDAALLSGFMRYPLMTLKVIGGIHFEALKLWSKGLPIHKKPEPPKDPVTIIFNADTKELNQ